MNYTKLQRMEIGTSRMSGSSSSCIELGLTDNARTHRVLLRGTGIDTLQSERIYQSL